MGETGELVIGGVGLARYLDPSKDAEKFAPLPVARLGPRLPQRRPRRAPRRRAALPRPRRRAGQARRAPYRAGRGRRRAAGAARASRGAAAAVRTHARRATRCWWATWCPTRVELRHRRRGARACASDCPPRSCRCSRWSTTCRPGRRARSTATPCRGRCPPRASVEPVAAACSPRPRRWLAERWAEILGVAVSDPTPTSSTTAAAAWPPRSWWRGSARGTRRCRSTTSTCTRRWARSPAAGRARRDQDRAPRRRRRRRAAPRSRRPCSWLPMLALVGLRWASVAAAISTVAALGGRPGRPTVRGGGSRWPGCVLFSPAGRIGIAAGGARLLLRGVRPGSYPRGGSVHVRLWAADRLAELSGATGVSRRVVDTRYARALGAKIGDDVDLHSAPPVTGLLKIGARRGRGAGGGPRRLLGRRRRRAHRQDPDRRRGHDRLAQHAAAGRADRQGLRGRGRVHGLRRGPRRSALGGLARAAGRQVRACPGRRPARRARAPGRSPTASRRCSSGCCPRWRRCRRSRSSRSASPARRPPRRRRAGRC